MRKIAVINQKGGVGKTTTTANLGHALARQGHRVMLVDLDPQGHLAACLGLFRAPHIGIDKVLLDSDRIDDHVVSTRELLELVPAGDTLGDFENAARGSDRAHRLLHAIEANDLDMDYVLFDCPPSVGLLAINAVMAADDLLVPVSGDYLSLTGLAKLMLTLRKIETLRGSELNKWIFLSRYVARRRLSREVKDKILRHFPAQFLETAISEAAVMAECAATGRTIFEYKGKSRSAEEFESLADDLLQGRVMNHEHEQASNVA